MEGKEFCSIQNHDQDQDDARSETTRGSLPGTPQRQREGDEGETKLKRNKLSAFAFKTDFNRSEGMFDWSSEGSDAESDRADRIE
jgi:hypothetical protein